MTLRGTVMRVASSVTTFLWMTQEDTNLGFCGEKSNPGVIEVELYSKRSGPVGHRVCLRRDLAMILGVALKCTFTSGDLVTDLGRVTSPHHVTCAETVCICPGRAEPRSDL